MFFVKFVLLISENFELPQHSVKILIYHGRRGNVRVIFFQRSTARVLFIDPFGTTKKCENKN